MERETFEQRRLGATFRACRALRHEFATPLSAAALHLEVARRAAARAEAIPEKVRAGLETGKEQLDEASRLLEGLTALGSAHEGDPALLDFADLVARAARIKAPELERQGLTLRSLGPSQGALVDGFLDELENATRGGAPHRVALGRARGGPARDAPEGRNGIVLVSRPARARRSRRDAVQDAQPPECGARPLPRALDVRGARGPARGRG